MISFVLRRLGAMLFVMFGASIVIFLMMHIAPGGPARAVLGSMATQAQVAHLEKELGLNQPLYVQYLKWLVQVLHGNLGNSIYFQDPVTHEVLARLGATLFLTLCAFVFAVVGGLLLGVIAAIRRNGWLDRAILFLSTFGVSFPPFYMGVLLVLVFSLKLHWLPMSGLHPVGQSTTVVGALVHVIMPAVALGAGPLATVARMMRSSTLEELNKDYIRTARSKGLGYYYVIGRHAVKNAMLPTIDLLGLQSGYIMTSTALVEVVFSWPGLGNLLITSINNRDLPLTQGIVLLITLLYSVINLVTDMLHASLDPRIQHVQ